MAEEGGLTCPVAIEFALDAVTLAESVRRANQNSVSGPGGPRPVPRAAAYGTS